jgi:cytochrome c oxidase assembly protein subunit 15
LFRFSLLTAACTLVLVCIGGLVTSKGVGMAVPDWPTSYGYNMFALPVSTWLTGGVFDEHTHRLVATIVGTLVVFLTRWLGGQGARPWLAGVAVVELAAGFLLLRLGPDWKGAGHFLMGIGGVVLLAAIVWTRNAAAPGMLPALGWWAFALVQLQGLLGGLRVILDKEVISGTTMGTVFGLIHGCLGQGFFVLLCFIALRQTALWRVSGDRRPTGSLALLIPMATAAIIAQLLLGASMRHQHAGLAIHDFPTAYGSIWPATDPAALERYNHARTDEVTVTQFQIVLQMLHRMGAVLALGLVWSCAWKARSASISTGLRRGLFLWAGLLGLQFALGAATIWTAKAADVATAHVAIGALSLATGVLLTLRSRCASTPDLFASPTGPRSGSIAVSG